VHRAQVCVQDVTSATGLTAGISLLQCPVALLARSENMGYKSKDGWSESYPYDFYVYKDENNVCPECKRTPVNYRVTIAYHTLRPDVKFTCVSDHTWVRQAEQHQCRWCEMEGTIQGGYAGEDIWWCEECLRDYNRDMIYQEWMNSDNKTGDL